MISWIPILLTIGRTLGKILISMLMELVTGRFLKSLILLPFEKLARRTTNTDDDKLIEKAKEDLHL